MAAVSLVLPLPLFAPSVGSSKVWAVTHSLAVASYRCNFHTPDRLSVNVALWAGAASRAER